MKNPSAPKVRSFFRFPLTWMVAGTIGILLVDTLFRLLAGDVKGITSLLLTLTASIGGILVYWLTMKYLAHRSLSELPRRSAGVEAGKGLLTGTLFILVSTGMIVILGGYSFQWAPTADPNRILLSTIESALGAAIVEELIFRGLMFQAIRQWLGNWPALAVTSLFFGVAHLGNPGATLWSALAITIEAGVLLGAAFLWRRNLWFAMGLHFAWNALEGMLGIPVSGHPATGLFTVTVSGAPLLTGGDFGLEGSIVPVMVSLLIAIPMLIAASRNRATD
jgi:uncharacterized protein